MKTDNTPIRQDLVLIGGGHSHALALRMLAMQPHPGVRITLVSDGSLTPYSGMLPGVIAGHYQHEEAHIDLARLCRYAGVRFINDRVTRLDPEQRQVFCRDHPPLGYDLVSIDTGSVPDASVPGAAEHAIALKPVAPFLAWWARFREQVLSDPQRPWRMATVGGGASGVEVLLAIQHRLKADSRAQQHPEPNLAYHLVTPEDGILASHNAGVRRRYERILVERGIQVHRNFRVDSIMADHLLSKEGKRLDLDAMLWTVSASAPAWLGESGLQVSPRGFIQVDDTLQSLSHPEVFAAGDVADQVNHQRPKAGVFAVRQGKPLAQNLLRALAGKPLQHYRPQKAFLSLISTGDRYAVASRSGWSLEGRWVWDWKDRIDRRFMRRFDEELPPAEDAAASEETGDHESPLMRCGGCGAKVGQSVLERVMKQLVPRHGTDILVGLDTPDDAAVVRPPPGKLLIQSVDAFRALVDDPWIFGQIAATHALGDLFAMGAQPHSAQALVTLPYADERKQSDDLLQLMSGALTVLEREGVALIGGHTAEGAEMTLGFALNGWGDEDQLLRKGGLRPGDRLILTKPLGTGTLFAADMRHQARGPWVEQALASMLTSNRTAAALLREHGARACTDVTGFGLVGHLAEMLRASNCTAALYLGHLPLLKGARECLDAGWLSSLHPQNLRGQHLIGNAADFDQHPLWALLFDPQTAGGLLAGIPEAQSEDCLQALHSAGYPQARCIGRVDGAGKPDIQLNP